ncbi:zinc finger protein [Fusarium acutatum]|uniref:Zinc finger protein n=1 Tax=Fusarium acutatum TaxID=78861 RepID=A0A8H4NGT5_9HYPO|nr:zinc finger protein [Fusarium acutatum]
MALTGSPDAVLRDDVTAVSAPQTFNCTQCKAKFSRQAHLKRHQNNHRSEKPFSCLHCALSSSRKDVIIRHTRNFHSDKAQAPIQDNSCSRSSFSPRRRVSRQQPGDSDGTASDKEHERMCTDGSGTLQQLYADGAIDEGLDDFNLDYDNSLSKGNSLLGLEDPSSSITVDILDMSGDLQFIDPAMSQMLGPDILLLPTDSLAMAPHDPGEIGMPSMRSRFSPISSSSIASCPPECRGAFFIEDDQYRRAKQNYDSFSTSERPSRFSFPSKVAVSRFVRVFFEYMAPHLPIVHPPTFNIASSPAPLLIEIMACGALYAKEFTAAQKLHSAAVLLMRVYGQSALFDDKGTKCQLWPLQASLLLYYFDAFGGDSQQERRAVQTLSHTMTLAEEAIEEIQVSEFVTYKEWVQQETLNRCLAAVVILSAALFLKSPDRCSLLTIRDARFHLPSTESLWLQDENDWVKPKETMYSTDTMKAVLDGCKLPFQMSDFGFATIVSALVCHISLFESLVGTQHPDLFTIFVDKVAGPVQVLKDAWEEQSSTQFLIDSSVTHMAHTTRSMILSTIFHLHGSQQLRTMKASFQHPHLLDRLRLEPAVYNYLPGNLEKALVMAAEMLRSDCQAGLGYIQSLGLYGFAPLSVTAAYEGALLLCWYLQNKQPNQSLDPVVDKLISDAMLEADGWADPPEGPLGVFVLELYANLFDSSVWQYENKFQISPGGQNKGVESLWDARRRDL